MPKDYAKKKPPKKKVGASRKKDNNSVPLSLWLMAFVLLALLSTGLYYLKFGDNKPQTQPASSAQPVKTQSKPVTKKLVNPATPKPKEVDIPEVDIPEYDLHEELITKEIKIPAEDLKLSGNLDKYYYLMSCGSFREKTRAEELKARIALTGNNSNIKAVMSKGETWYRVELGPFSRKRKAEGIRHRLEKNSISRCIINRHIKKD